jgi:CheY-like chemotaxis protein
LPRPGPTVLIVEDEAYLRELWRRALIGFGYEVIAVRGALEALPLLTHEPHVAVCDVHLPGPNGLWLADQIRDASPTTAIVLATGDSTIPPVESLQPGVVAYLVKPFTLKQLQDAAEEGVRWSAVQRSR